MTGCRVYEVLNNSTRVRTAAATRSRPSPSSARGTREGPGSAERILRVLEAYHPTDSDLSLSEISTRTGMTKSSVHRALATLTTHGFIEQDLATRRYRLGIRLFEIGSGAIHQRGLHGVAYPALVELTRETGETGHLAVMSGTEAVYVYKIEGTSNFSMSSRVGGRCPAYCTSIGKVLLAWSGDGLFHRVVKEGLRSYTSSTITSASRLRAELEAVRNRGYAIDDMEYHEGLRCIAAPIRDHAGAVIAAIGIAGSSHSLKDGRFQALIPQVIRAGLTVSRGLGYVDIGRLPRVASKG